MRSSTLTQLHQSRCSTNSTVFIPQPCHISVIRAITDYSYPPATSDPNLFRPKLTVNVHLQDGVAVDASLTQTSRDFLKKIAASLSPDHRHPAAPTSEAPLESASTIPSDGQRTPGLDVQSQSETEACSDPQHDSVANVGDSDGAYETIEVPLVFDGEFFDILQSDVNNLDALQAEEEKKMTDEIIALGKEVAQVAKPTRFSKSDLARWRYIFELYLDAEVFFATHEQDHGARSSQVALKQLQWFQSQVDERSLTKDFKLAESKLAFARFLNLNATLLKNLQFQELNKTAVTKILKS